MVYLKIIIIRFLFYAKFIKNYDDDFVYYLKRSWTICAYNINWIAVTKVLLQERCMKQ